MGGDAITPRRELLHDPVYETMAVDAPHTGDILEAYRVDIEFARKARNVHVESIAIGMRVSGSSCAVTLARWAREQRMDCLQLRNISPQRSSRGALVDGGFDDWYARVVHSVRLRRVPIAFHGEGNAEARGPEASSEATGASKEINGDGTVVIGDGGSTLSAKR